MSALSMPAALFRLYRPPTTARPAAGQVIHGRWAMLGAAGFLAPEILASAGVIPATPEEAVWFRSGVIPPAGQYGERLVLLTVQRGWNVSQHEMVMGFCSRCVAGARQAISRRAGNPMPAGRQTRQ